VEALGKAIGILGGSSVSGAAKEHLPALAQSVRKAASFLQLSGSDPNRLSSEASEAAVARFLEKEGQRIGSRVLDMLAVRVRDTDVFAKVKKMIQDLVERLLAEEADEAQHKGWCDTELGKNEQTRNTKTQEVDTLHATIEQTTSAVEIRKREIADLNKAVATLTAEMAEATKLRKEEKERNEDTIADAVGGQMSLTEAIKTLKDYYDSAAASTVLLTKETRKGHQAPTPEIFDKPFTGQQTEYKNVIAFLEVIQTDFARLETETTAAETAAQDEYDKTSAAAQADLAAKKKDITNKEADLSSKEGALQTAINDLGLAQSELDAALAYYEKLKPSCVGADADSSYKERVARREEEIAALKEALAILSGETIVGGPDSLYSSVDGGNRGWDVQ